MKSACFLSFASFFLLVACGPADENPDQGSQTDGDGSKKDVVNLSDPDVNGSSVTCSRQFQVDASAWPSEGYPTGASGIYRYVSEFRYDGPTDGKLPSGASTGFYLILMGEDPVWTILSTKGIDGSDDGYPWDHHGHGADCPDDNVTWANGALVKAL